MKNFDVQSAELNVSNHFAFSYIANPANLPSWAQAFASVGNGKAWMRTPNGEVEIDLIVKSSPEYGAVDWFMIFPDGSTAVAYSRIVKLTDSKCVYCFVLTPPPVPLELLEGALESQSKILAEELLTLKSILETTFTKYKY